MATKMMHAMSEHAGVGVLPFDGMGLYEQPRPPRLVFKMPRVVPDQKAKFESDELFRRLSRESEVSSPRKGREREAPAWITIRDTLRRKDHARTNHDSEGNCLLRELN